MSIDWLDTTWGEIATLEYGKSLRDYRDRKGAYRVYGTNGPIGWHNNSLSDRDGVIVGRKGAYRGVHYSPNPFFVIDTAFYLKPTRKLELRWAYYQLLTQDINGMDSGSAIPSTSRDAFYNLPVKVPPLAEQKVIARILAAFDDKIELNRRMNETLEAMARAIFKSWFVDFDPVRAKLDGRQPTGIDPQTAALFPDSFERVDGELVPKGWQLKSLGEVITVKHGFAFKGEYFRKEAVGDVLLTPGNFAVGGGFKGSKFKYYDGPVEDEYVLAKNDLVVTMTDLSKAGDTLGYPAFVPPRQGPRFLHNQRLGKVGLLPESKVGFHFLFHALCSYGYRHHVLATASGSTVRHTSPGRICEYELVIPSSSVAAVFEKIVSPIHAKQVANDAESHSLAATRDALLPKLLSGKLRSTLSGIRDPYI